MPVSVVMDNLFVLLLVGLIAGFLASKVMTGAGMGLIWDIVVGVLGAFLHFLFGFVAHVRLRTCPSKVVRSWPRR